MSGGYHPKIRMSFPSALALGVEGFDEVLELEMSESADMVDPDILLADLNRYTINGLNFLRARKLDEGGKKAKLVSSVFGMTVPDEYRKAVALRISSFLDKSSVFIEKSNGRQVDVRKAVTAIDYDENSGHLTVKILAQDGPEAGVRELLRVLELGQELFKSIFPKRICCHLANEGG